MFFKNTSLSKYDPKSLPRDLETYNKLIITHSLNRFLSFVFYNLLHVDSDSFDNYLSFHGKKFQISSDLNQFGFHKLLIHWKFIEEISIHWSNYFYSKCPNKNASVSPQT